MRKLSNGLGRGEGGLKIAYSDISYPAKIYSLKRSNLILNLRHYVSILSLAVICAVPAVAHADTIATLAATGTLTDGGTLSGSVTFNESTGVVTASDLIVTDSHGTFTFNAPFGHG